MLPARRGLALRCWLPYAVALRRCRNRTGCRRAATRNSSQCPPRQPARVDVASGRWLRLPSCRLLVHHSKEGQMNRIMTLGVGCLVLVGAGCVDDAAIPTRPRMLTASQPSPTHPAGVIQFSAPLAGRPYGLAISAKDVAL